MLSRIGLLVAILVLGVAESPAAAQDCISCRTSACSDRTWLPPCKTQAPAAPKQPKASAPAKKAPPEEEPPRASSVVKASDMVSIPGGSFFMGCNERVDTECDSNEKPGREREVSAFRIDRTEVTVEAYRRCVDAGGCSDGGLRMPYWGGKEQPTWAKFCNWGEAGRDSHPINCLDWHQAEAYCAWAKKRLPTEAEWEKAARGTDSRKYSWGNVGYSGVGKRVANIADLSAKREYPSWTTAEDYDDGFVETAPVGSFPAGASPYGVLDMIGNVCEWTADWSEPGKTRILRGGSFRLEPRLARASIRFGDAPAERHSSIGFRCAQ